MSEKEYIVTLNKGVDPASFAAEMTQSTGSSTVPNRSVDVANARLASQRNTHYALSEAEAEALLKSVTVNAINIMYEGQFVDEAERTLFETDGSGGFLTIQEVANIVLEQLYYDTWDGILPQVITGTDGLSIILPTE